MSIEFYNKNAEEFYNGTISADMSENWDKFLLHIPDKGKILDAGCGSGRDSLYFLNRGYNVVSIDASEEMVKMSSQLTGQRTLLLKFQDIDFTDEFDGVWACASLLHVEKTEIKGVMEKIVKSLKEKGILFASFKYGHGEVCRDERLFNSYDESSLEELIQSTGNLGVLKIWTAQDVRPGRENEKWVSCLCKRISTR
jgi:SAM-dependent methyltransferase